MEYKLKYIAKECKHGWSVWLKRDVKDVMIGSAIKTEEEVYALINNIPVEIEARYEPDKEIKNLKKKVKELKGYKEKYEELVKYIDKLNFGGK